MSKPIFTLPTSPIAAGRRATKAGLETEMNRVIDQLFLISNEKADEVIQVGQEIEQNRIASEQAASTANQKANDASAFSLQAQLAALAAGAPLFLNISDGLAATSDQDIFLVYQAGNVSVYTNDNGSELFEGVLFTRQFDSVQDLVSSTEASRGVGGIWRAGAFIYEEVASSGDVQTAAGVELNVLPNSSGKYSIEAFGINPSKTSPVEIYDLIVSGIEFEVPKQICSLDGISSRWQSGEKFPLCFFGDSTTDGRVTTIDGSSPATVWNLDRLVGGSVPDGLNYDHDDTEVPNAYPNILQRLARLFFRQSSLRIYNAGFRGQQLQDGWAAANVHNAVYANSFYQDSKFLFINFGLNDVNAQTDDETLVQRTKDYTKAIAFDAFQRGIQPVLMTTNLNVARIQDSRSSYRVAALIDRAKIDVAKELQLAVIDMNKFLNDYSRYNNTGFTFSDLNADNLHLNDLGHLKQAEFLLKEICGSVLIPEVGREFSSIDITHPACRPRVNAIYNPARGANLQHAYGQLNATTLTNFAGQDLVDLFVWCDAPDTSLILGVPLGVAWDYTELSSFNNAPRYVLQSRLATAGDFYERNKEIRQPELNGLRQPTRQLDSPLWVGQLEYGLNRVRYFVPSSVQSAIVSNDQTFIGYFTFLKNCAETKLTAINQAQSSIPYDVARQWNNCLRDSGILRHASIRGDASDIFALPYNPVVGNRFSMTNPDDWVQWRFNLQWADHCRVILGHHNWTDSASVAGDLQKRLVYGTGYCFVAYTGQQNIGFGLMAPNGNLFDDIDTSVNRNSHNELDLVLHCQRQANGGVLARLYNRNWGILWTHTWANSTRIATLLAMGAVGGAASASSGNPFTINKIDVRQRLPELDSVTQAFPT